MEKIQILSKSGPKISFHLRNLEFEFAAYLMKESVGNDKGAPGEFIKSNFKWIKHWDQEQQSKAQNSDSKYRQMALVGFDTQTTELGS